MLTLFNKLLSWRIVFFATLLTCLLESRPMAIARVAASASEVEVSSFSGGDSLGVSVNVSKDTESLLRQEVIGGAANNTFSSKHHLLYWIIGIFAGVLLILSGFAIHYFCDSWKHAPIGRTWHVEVGYQASRLLSWLFSVKGLFVLLVFAVLWLVTFMITNAVELTNDGSNSVLQLLTVTLTVALSTLIPTMVSRMVSRNQLQDIVEQQFESELQKYKTSLNEIRKDKGHSCRMSAVLLEQWAHSNMKGDNKTIARDYAAWAIGWASSAITQYLLIQQQYENARKHSAFCLNVINKAASDIEGNGQRINIKFSDFQSLVTMHALIKYYNLVLPLQEKAIELRYKDPFQEINQNAIVEWRSNTADFQELFKKVESLLYSQLEEKDKDFVRSGFCSITGMTKEFNDQLDLYVKEIVKTLKKENEDGQSKHKNEQSSN